MGQVIHLVTPSEAGRLFRRRLAPGPVRAWTPEAATTRLH